MARLLPTLLAIGGVGVAWPLAQAAAPPGRCGAEPCAQCGIAEGRDTCPGHNAQYAFHISDTTCGSNVRPCLS